MWSVLHDSLLLYLNPFKDVLRKFIQMQILHYCLNLFKTTTKNQLQTNKQKKSHQFITENIIQEKWKYNHA